MANTEAAAVPSAEAPGAGQPPFFELSRLMVVAVDTSTSFLPTRATGRWIRSAASSATGCSGAAERST